MKAFTLWTHLALFGDYRKPIGRAYLSDGYGSNIIVRNTGHVIAHFLGTTLCVIGLNGTYSIERRDA